MKKIISVLLCAVLLTSLLVGCGSKTSDTTESNQLKIITSMFPEYDWLSNITKNVDNIDLTMLLDSGVDLHSYQPTAEDILNMSNCDVFVYVGGESSQWIDDVIKDKDILAINLLSELGNQAKEEEVVDGMQAEDEKSGEEETALDEHIWLSLKNAEILCQIIADKLSEADGENQASYQANTKAYIKQLKELDGQYQSACENAKYDTLIFGDRFPFRYLTDDYHLKYYAAFAGCSAETEASFETIKFLSDKLTELRLPAVMVIDDSNQKMAKTIISTSDNKDAQILSLNSMQSATLKNFNNGETYLGIMESNLKVLSKALN